MTAFNEYLLLKVLTGTARAEEVEQVKIWLSASEENKQTYTRLRMLWQAGKISEYASAEAMNEALARFNNNVDDKQKPRRTRLPLYTLVKYAAIFTGVVMLGALAYWLVPSGRNQVMVEYSVPVGGEVKSVLLPDGSKVALNEGSTLKTPAEFKKRKRLVELEGEAFFEVARMPQSRFVVETTDLQVEVTGTSFNVNTFGDRMQTVLVSGSVSLTDKKDRQVLAMKPGELAVYHSVSRKLEVSSVKTPLYTSWKDGLVMFDKATLNEILEKLEQVYYVQFEYNAAKVARDTNRYNFVFRKSQPFDTVNKMLRFITPRGTYKVKKEAKE